MKNLGKNSASPVIIASALLIILLVPSIASYQNASAISSKRAAPSSRPAQSTSFQDISFDVSGATLYNTSNSGNSPYYYYAVQQGSTITITASGTGVNDPSYGGATSTLSITFSFVNPDGSDLVFSQNGNGEATSVSGSYQITSPNFPFVSATVDFLTSCGSLRGCPSYWQSNSINLVFNVQPQLTIQANATAISAPATIQLYGTVFPSTEAVNLTILKDGSYFDQYNLNPDLVTGSYNWNETIYSPADYGLYRAIATVSNSDPITQSPGNSTVAAMFTSTAEADFSVDSGSVDTSTSSNVITSTTDLYNPTTTYAPPDTTTNDNPTTIDTTYYIPSETTTTSGVQTPFYASILDPTGRPLRGVQVQLFWSTDSSSDPSLFLPISDVYYTDANGQVLINDPRIESSMQGWGYLQVTLATDTFSIKDNSTFIPDGASSVYDLKNASFDLPSDNFFTVNSAADLQRTFTMVSTQTQPAFAAGDLVLGDYTHMGQLAATFVDVMNAVLFWSDNVNLHFEGYAIPIIAYAPQGKTYFSPAAKPFIAMDSTDVQFLGDIPNYEYHEFAHYVMWKYFGEGAYFSLRPKYGDANHAGFSNPNSMDAWEEGWAEFWGMATWNYAHGITDPTRFNAAYTMQAGSAPRDLNNVVPVNLVIDKTKYDRNAEEDSLSTLLWSLYSGTDDLDGRTIMLSAPAMWDILTSSYNLCTGVNDDQATCRAATRQIQTITDLYFALTNSINIQTYGYSKAEIDKIFVARYIYELNADGTKTIGIDNCCGYPNPASSPARNIRYEEPVDNGSGMVINSDPSSLPYTLMIQINYQAPYQQDDYSVPINITQPQQTVYLWLPPASIYNTTAQLTATNQHGEQKSVGAITGVEYAKNSESGVPLLQTAPIQLSTLGSPATGSTLVDLVILGAIIVLPVLGVALFLKRRMNRKTP